MRVLEIPRPGGGTEAGPLGWIAIDSLVDGLAFGGLRISASVSRAEVEGLARAMSAKLAVHGSPVGGAKGGLRVDPADPELSLRIREFAAVAGQVLRAEAILGKDMGASTESLDALYAALGFPQLQLVRQRPGGKACPARLRELPGYRPHMTGLGVAWAARAACDVLGIPLSGARVAIQGFGAVGAGSAQRLGELGARVVAVSERNSAWRVARPLGGAGSAALDVPALLAARRPDGTLDPERAAAAGARRAPRESLFAEPAEILVLAAASHSVGPAEAAAVAAPLVLEGSNFGLSPEARALLASRGIALVPDVIASSSSAAMVGLQIQAAGGLTDAELWPRIEAAIDGAARGSLHTPARVAADTAPGLAARGMISSR